MKVRRIVAPCVALATVFYVAKGLWPDAAFFQVTLGKLACDAIGVATKLASLLFGSVYGVRSALALDPSNPARRPWLALGVWLTAFSLGEIGLGTYMLILRRDPPLPSVADVAFLVGYAAMIWAAVAFIRVYHATGFPIGSAREHAGIAIGAAIVLGAAGVPLLSPIVHAPVSVGERAINVAYPVLDLIALASTTVLIRITSAFRGGSVWTVWGAMLTGWIFMTIGDVLFAYLSSIGKESLTPFVDLTLLLGYFFVAVGTKLQHELLTTPVEPAC